MSIQRSLIKFSLFSIFTILALNLASSTNAQVVCSLDELIRELYDDIIDNGKLDCLRKSVNPNEGDESEEQRAKRKAAEWTSDCSFEADGTGNAAWLPKFLQTYNLKKGLVDVNGNPVEDDFEDQADMCEIVRALIANGKIPEVGEDVSFIDLKVLDYIDCPGGDGQTQICAATGKSFADKKGWYIPIDGKTLMINNEPKYELDQNSK